MSARVPLTVVGAVVLALTAACTGDPGSEPAASAVPSGACAAPAVSAEGVIEPAATGGSVAGLVFGELPARSGTTLKIVWRVTGTGDLEVTARRPDGSVAPLDFGPQFHATSNFDRPGEEWGTGFRFDTAGCWEIDLRRGDVSATVPIPVIG